MGDVYRWWRYSDRYAGSSTLALRNSATSSTPVPAAGSTVVSSASPWASSRSSGSPSVGNTVRTVEGRQLTLNRGGQAQREARPRQDPPP
ncbi:hypothetical protein IG631_15567 [Alternaria alternata]|nr:hypothetical protein IG631_15567 [Alternaria alternata]